MTETRTEWIVGKTLSNAISIVNSVFCDSCGEHDDERADLDNIIEIALESTNKTMVEDLIAVLERMLKTIEKNNEDYAGTYEQMVDMHENIAQALSHNNINLARKIANENLGDGDGDRYVNDLIEN